MTEAGYSFGSGIQQILVIISLCNCQSWLPNITLLKHGKRIARNALVDSISVSCHLGRSQYICLNDLLNSQRYLVKIILF